MGKVAFTCLILLLAVVLVADSFGIRINRRRRSSLRRRTIYTARRRTVVYRRRTHTRYGTSTSIMLSRILRESGSLKRLLYLINSRTATIDSRLRGLITNIGSGVRTTRLYIRNMVNRIYNLVNHGHRYRYRYGDYLKDISNDHQADYDAMIASLAEELENDYGDEVASLITNALDYAIRNEGDEISDEDEESVYGMIAEAITDEDEDAIQNEVESNDQGDEAKEETLA